MSLTQFSIDDGPHSMDGLRLLAQDGTDRIEAFIGRKVMDVWAESVEHSGGRRSLFRGQYNALGKLLQRFSGLLARNTSVAPRSTASIRSSRYCSRTSWKAVRF
jgi:hypothetical protein